MHKENSSIARAHDTHLPAGIGCNHWHVGDPPLKNGGGRKAWGGGGRVAMAAVNPLQFSQTEKINRMPVYTVRITQASQIESSLI